VTGGDVGPASVQVRSVGGGELWDDFIDLIPALSNNETIGGVLSGRDIRHRASSGVDYIQLDTTLNLAVSLSALLFTFLCVPRQAVVGLSKLSYFVSHTMIWSSDSLNFIVSITTNNSN